MKCQNCHKSLSCGCQKKTASNGTIVCTSCINAYEAALKSKNKPGSSLLKMIIVGTPIEKE